MGGSGMAARNALPNTSIQTVQEVIDYETQVMSNTDLPIVADGENGGGSPVTTYRTVAAAGAGRRRGDHARGLDRAGERVRRQGRGDGVEGRHGRPDQGGGGRAPGPQHR